VALQRLTTAGTQGTGQTEMEMDEDGPAPDGLLFTTHSGAPTITTGYLVVADLAAAIGAGVIWTWDAEPVHIPGTANVGVGITVPNGTITTGLDVTFVWEE
jgi:hypothetical protein